jgi:hypothetical protein
VDVVVFMSTLNSNHNTDNIEHSNVQENDGDVNLTQPENENQNQGGSECSEDLIGAPFGVIESDPGK